MYRIIAYNEPTDTAGFVIHDPAVNESVSEGKLNLKQSDVNDLSLTINQDNPLFGNVRPMHTHVEVYDEDKLIFRGRALKPTREMKDSGQFLQTYVFEDISSYLIDSVQRFLEVRNATPKQFLEKVIEEHNIQVPAYKQFNLRTVTVDNSKDNALRTIDYATTQETIKKLLTDSVGGFLITEYKDGKNYLDYLKAPGKDHNNDTPIRITENMQSASVTIDPSKVITRLVPLGAQIETQNPDKKNDDSSDDGTKLSGPMHAVNGDWGPAIKFAAQCMNTKVTNAQVATIKNVIQHESGGSETVVNNWDSNAAAGHPSKGLLQFIDTTFKAYAIEGYTDILKGFHQLLAMFNDSNWASDVHTGGWGPTGKRRYDKLPVEIVAGGGGNWGSPFPSVGHVAFESGQLFGVHPGGEFRQNGFHDGLDFGTAKYPGSDVHAVHGGKVTHKGYMGGLAYYFVTHSDDGYNIVYQEAFGSSSNIKVKIGDYVKTGQVVGRRTTNHLHVGVTKKDFNYAVAHSFTNNGTWIDPEPLIFGSKKRIMLRVKQVVADSPLAKQVVADSPLAKQALDIEAGVKLFEAAKSSHLKYETNYLRADILSNQAHGDCSSFVSYFLELAVHETDRTLYTTDTLHRFLKKHGYSLHYEGNTKTLPALQTGDVFILGKKGAQPNHTAVMKDADTLLECAQGWSNGYDQGGADMFEHGKSGDENLAAWWKRNSQGWKGEWYWYLYRFGGNIPEQESGDQKGGTIKSGVRYTIAPVNDGKDYLEIPDFQKEFGIINGAVTWDDVKDPNELLSKAKAWIRNQKASTNSWNISALELPDYDHFKVYDRYLFVNPYVADTQLLTVVSKEIDITNPFKSTLTIGDKTPKLTDYQNENRNISKEVSKLASTVTTISGDVSAMRGGAGNSSSQLQTIYDRLGNTNVPQLQKDVEGIQDFSKKADERLTTAETDLKTVKEDDESTKQKLAEYEKTIADLNERLKKLEGAGS